MNASAFRLKCDPVVLQMALAELDVSVSGYFYDTDRRPARPGVLLLGGEHLRFEMGVTELKAGKALADKRFGYQ